MAVPSHPHCMTVSTAGSRLVAAPVQTSSPSPSLTALPSSQPPHQATGPVMTNIIAPYVHVSHNDYLISPLDLHGMTLSYPFNWTQFYGKQIRITSSGKSPTNGRSQPAHLSPKCQSRATSVHFSNTGKARTNKITPEVLRIYKDFSDNQFFSIFNKERIEQSAVVESVERMFPNRNIRCNIYRCGECGATGHNVQRCPLALACGRNYVDANVLIPGDILVARLPFSTTDDFSSVQNFPNKITSTYLFLSTIVPSATSSR